MQTLGRLGIVCLSAMAAFGADAKRRITEKDIYDFQWIAGAQIAPDGSRVVYTHVKVAPKHDTYESALWMAPAAGGAPRQISAGPRDSEARWSPDGKTIAFIRAGEKPQIWLLPMEGGEA